MGTPNQKSLAELKKELEKFKKGDKIVRRFRTTPLGKLFDEISKIINGYENKSDVIGYLYSQLGGSKEQKDAFEKRKFVISHVLDYLEKINGLSEKKEESAIISIPLYDLRIVGELTNIIIVHGIYSTMPSYCLIPFEMRKVQNFKSSTITFTKIDFKLGTPMLKEILTKFTNILETNSDLRDLVLVGTGFTDVLSIAILFSTFSPEFQSYLERLELQSSTYQLLSFYSLLYKHAKKETKFSAFISSLLSKQLMKPNGVESLIDLVLGLREDEEVDIAKVEYIVQILITSKPQNLSLIEYYRNIFGQIYEILIFVNRPLMNTILVEIISSIYGKNKKVIVDFLFVKVWKHFNPVIDAKNDSIILTNEVDLNNAFNVCVSLIRSLSNMDELVINEFFEPIILSLWYYANYQRKEEKDFDIILGLIKTVIVIGDSAHFIELIVSNLRKANFQWIFATGENGLTLIKYNTREYFPLKENNILALFDEIDYNVETFVKLITKLNDSDYQYLNTALITVLNNLLSTMQVSEIDIPIQKIAYVKLIQSLLQKFKSEIEGSPITLLVFANTYFNQYFESLPGDSKLNIVHDADSDDEDDNEANLDDDILYTMIPILEILSNFSPTKKDEKQQLENLQALLKSNKAHIPDAIKAVTNRILGVDLSNLKLEIKKDAFDMETIMKQINDPTPSIRVYAIDKLTKYTVREQKEQKVISTKYTYNLLISQLKDSEPYVYLNGIKNLVTILSFDKVFLSDIIKQYSLSKKTIDEKLRIGEVLTKFITVNGKLFNEHEIREIVNMCVSIARCDSKLQQENKDNKDIKMKMSSLSILGLLCFEVGFGIAPYVDEIADLVHGIITFEASPELRRAAVVIISDIVKNEKGLKIIKSYGEKLEVLLDYIAEKDQDLLVCQNAANTLALIDEAFNKQLKISSN